MIIATGTRRVIASLLAVFLAVGGAAAGTVGQERQGGFVGPAEGETLTEWTARWMEGPVQYIATDEEKDLYGSLETTQERLQFIRLFWERRDPRVRGRENEFLEEFIRRVEYAEEEFGAEDEPGWKTLFGRVVLILGPPSRTRRELGLGSELSDRPPILWTYDERIPEYPANEDLLFVFKRGRWRLMPPSPIADSGVDAARRELERSSLIAEMPADFERAIETTIEESLIRPVDYTEAIRRVEAAVAFPDAEIPFGWSAEFGDARGAGREIRLNLTWRMESLIFHVVDERFHADMQVRATLLDDGEPVADTSEWITVEVPVDELEARAGELVERTIDLEAAPGTYELELVLEDQLLGYRTTYRDTLEVPAR